MILSDWALIAALAVFVLAWWARPLPGRGAILLVAALAAIGMGVAGVMDDRWQAGLGVCVGLVFLATLAINRLRKAPARGGAPFVSGGVFALLGAAAIGLLWLFPMPALPAPTGEHVVGVQSFELVDERRRGLLGADADAPRRLLVRVWYPAQAHAVGQPPERYFTEAEADATGTGMGALVRFPPFFTYVKHVRTHSYRDAPLLEGAHDLPTIFYSHGYTSFLSQNTALMEELASHGYVVFSIQHTGDSAPTVFPNLDVAPMDPALIETMRTQAAAPLPQATIDAMAGETLDVRFEGRLSSLETAAAEPDRITRSAPIWLADRLFVHDALQNGGAPEHVAAIVAASNLARVGEMGMSFGGSTSGGVCMIDPRCAAAINLDGADFHFAPFAADMPVPFLMFHSDMAGLYESIGRAPQGPARGFNEFSYEALDRAGARSDVVRVQLRGARHLGISDFSWFMRRPVRDGLLGTTPADVMLGAQNDFVRGFFDRYLRGEDNQFPAPQMAAYRDWISPASNADVPAWWAAKTPEERAAIEARIAAAKAAYQAFVTR